MTSLLDALGWFFSGIVFSILVTMIVAMWQGYSGIHVGHSVYFYKERHEDYENQDY